MNNIFENAYFGKPYKTRDRRKAVYCNYEMIYGVVPNSEHSITKHLLLINNLQFVNVFEDGSTVKGEEYSNDIVSEWQKEIDEEELDKLAEEETHEKYYYTLDEKGIKDFQIGFKAGYRKALELQYE